MAKVAIPPVKLPWREQDIKSGDPELLANYLKVLVKTLQKKIEEIGNVVNMNADKVGGGGGDMLKADYDPDNDGKVEKADYADNAGYANNSGKLNNHSDIDFMLKADYDSDGDSKVDNAENADNAQTLQGKEPTDFADINHTHKIEDLNNVNISSPTDSQVIAYNETNSEWVNKTIPDGDMYKSTYDPDDDGKVENADHADTADDANTLQGNEPSAFANVNHTHSVEDLSDTEINNPQDAHVLFYSNGKWVNASSVHSHYIGDLVDVNISNPSDGQVLTYDNQNNNWKNTTLDFTCSKQQNGYTKLPNGLIIQWGKVTVNVTNTDAHWECSIQVNFSIQFPNAVFSITMTRDNYNTADIFVLDFRLKNINKYGFYFDFLVQGVGTTGTVNWFWMAIGH